MSDSRKLTSRQAINRILWDGRLDPTVFTIGHTDRVDHTIHETPLTQWTGEIPSHRIVHLRCDGEIVWSRHGQDDRLSDPQLPAMAWRERPATAVASSQDAFRPRPVFRWRDDAWVMASPTTPEFDCHRLVIATWNVLSETHHPDQTQPVARRDRISQQLQRLRPDILALQEVTPGLWAELLAQDWCRSYFVSEPPSSEMIAGGIVFLSRLPFALWLRDFTPRPVLLGRWELASGPLDVAAVHLPSNRSQSSLVPADERQRQLGWLLEQLSQRKADALVLGDLNMVDAEADVLAGAADFVDLWPYHFPADSGYTFDPDRNPLAQLTTVSGRAARFDRMLWRAVSQQRSTAIRLFAQEVPASDHFGLVATWEPASTLHQVPPVHTSALVLIPSADLWEPIQSIRKSHDQRFDRWMPHINLVYGFVPEKHFAEAVRLLESALAAFPPFDITLDRLATFQHARSCTGWLQPTSDPPGELHRLQAILEGLFPLCDEQGTKSSAGYTPHLSIGQFPSPAAAHTAVPTWTPIRFRVDSVCLISRRGNEPFEIRQSVSLGSGGERLLPPVLSAEQERLCTAVLELIQHACSEVLGTPAAVQVAGSVRLGVADSESDLDLVWAIPDGDSVLDRLKQLETRVAALGPTRFIADARIPVLRTEIQGVAVDVTAGENATECGQLALLACKEADYLLADAERSVGVTRYRHLLRAVRAWAKVRHLSGTIHGLLGGHAWAILVATACRSAPPDERWEALLTHLFQMLTQHDWTQPITLTDEATRYHMEKRDRLAIVTPLPPCFNCSRSVTISTARLLQREWERAARLARQGAWTALFQPARLLDQSRLFLELPDARALGGPLVGLMVELEKRLHAVVRPWPGTRVLGLSLPSGVKHADVQECFARWMQRLGVEPAECALRGRKEMAEV